MTTPVCLIDSSIYIFRYYFALPDNWFSQVRGYPTGAVYGYTTFLLRLLEQVQPSHLAACYDESLGNCFRNQIYPDYKVSRVLPDEALAFQLKACRQVSELLGIPSFASDTHEADDLIGSLARVARRSPRPIAILTRDKDLGQLLHRPQDYLWELLADQRTHADDLEAKMGVRFDQLVDYLALVGDSIDDIPGVPGIGAKTACQLLQAFDSIDGLFARLDEVAALPLRGARGLSARLLAHREQIAVARRLACIEERLPLGVKLADLQWAQPDWTGLEAFFAAMGFARGLSTRARRAVGADRANTTEDSL